MCRTRKLKPAQVVISAIVAILVVSSTSPSYAGPDARVLAAARTCEPKARVLSEQLVQIDSGTGDVAGLVTMGATLKIELEQLGANVESVSAMAPAVGDNVVAVLNGTGKGRILLVAHMDTVFPRGTVAQRPYRVVGDHGIHPGAGDD